MQPKERSFLLSCSFFHPGNILCNSELHLSNKENASWMWKIKHKPAGIGWNQIKNKDPAFRIFTFSNWRRQRRNLRDFHHLVHRVREHRLGKCQLCHESSSELQDVVFRPWGRKRSCPNESPRRRLCRCCCRCDLCRCDCCRHGQPSLSVSHPKILEHWWLRALDADKCPCFLALFIYLSHFQKSGFSFHKET